MKKDRKFIVTKTAAELAAALGLSQQDALEFEFRARLTDKIMAVVEAKRMTHLEIANRSGASRTRITALLNGSTRGVSTDFLLRILYSLGYRANVSFVPVSKLHRFKSRTQKGQIRRKAG